MDPVNVRPNLKCAALSVPDIIAIALLWMGLRNSNLGKGGRRGSGVVPSERTLVIPISSLYRLFPISTRLCEILHWSFGWDRGDCEPSSLGKRRPQGVWHGTVRKSVGDFLYRTSIETVPLPLRISEILPLLCSSAPLFPTPPLVSPKVRHVPK